MPSGRFPDGFLWGTAISAYQSEGNNYNSDAWVAENVTPTLFRERSGDACDSYHRYAEDIAIAELANNACASTNPELVDAMLIVSTPPDSVGAGAALFDNTSQPVVVDVTVG